MTKTFSQWTRRSQTLNNSACALQIGKPRSTFLTGRCILFHWRCCCGFTGAGAAWQRHRRGARFGERALARLNRRLAFFSKRRRSSSSRIALERRSSAGRCNTGNSTGCVSSRSATSSGTATSSCTAGSSLAGSSPTWSGPAGSTFPSFTRRLCDCWIIAGWCVDSLLKTKKPQLHVDFVICFTSAVESHS